MGEVVSRPLGWGNRCCYVLTLLAVCATVILALIDSSTVSIALLVLFLIGMYLGFRYGFGRGLAAGEKCLIWITAINFAVILFCYVNGLETILGFHVLGRYLRFVLIIPVYLALRHLTPPRWAIWLAFVAGALVAGGNAVAYCFDNDGAGRAAGNVIAITFGDLALLIGFVAAVLTPPVRCRRDVVLLALGLLGLAGGLIASILSGTRGGWLAIPFFAVLLIVALMRELTIRWRVVIGAAVVVAVVVVVAIPATGVMSRAGKAVQSWQEYGHYHDRIAPLPYSFCVSRAPVVKGLAQLTNADGVNVTATQDAHALAAAGFAKQCVGGTALRITNPDSAHGHWVYIPRIVAHVNRPGMASVLARGAGQVKVPGIPARRVHWNQYRRVNIAGKPDSDIVYMRLEAYVPAGGTLYLVPLQVNPGAYRHFYADTSVSARLAMWTTAWRIFADHWLIGAGTGAYRAVAAQRVDARQAAPVTTMFDHPHSQYLDVMAERGVIGLIVFLLMLGVPAWLFAARLNSSLELVRRSAYAGLMTVGGYVIFGLTETIFIHSMMIGCYVIFVSLFAAMMYRAEDTAAAAGTPVTLAGSRSTEPHDG